MNDDTDVPPRSSRQNPAYRPTSDSPALHSQRIQSDARQIHTRSVAPYLARCAQYGLWGALLLRNTGSVAPYCYAIRDAGSGYVLTTLRAYAYAIALSRALRSIRALLRPIAAQYGLWLRLCAHCVARIRLRYRPISRVALNTGSLSSRGCAPLTPGCILAPFQGALFPPRHICHICRRQMSIPPRHICHICRRLMSIPHLHLWRGGGRQAGSEVKTPLMERPLPSFN